MDDGIWTMEYRLWTIDYGLWTMDYNLWLSANPKNSMFAAMQLREFYNHYLIELKPLYEFEEASAISTMVFEYFAKADKTAIITYPHRDIQPEELILLEDALLQLKRNTPVQYVIGHTWFAGLLFKVTPAVLIPRPETEELVKAAVDFCKNNNSKNLLDIGTGSGCIAVSIKKKLDLADVHAVDISREALVVSKENAARNDVPVKFFQLDFLDETQWPLLKQYDVIISNPPYIPEHEKELLDKNVVSYEPHLALFVPDEEALIFYEKIAAFGVLHLADGGSIFMETHENLAKKVSEHFNNNGYIAVIKKDMFEKERMVIATRYH